MSRIRLTQTCPTCNGDLHTRVRRRLWMRVIPKSRLYRCAGCGARILWVLDRVAIQLSRRFVRRRSRI